MAVAYETGNGTEKNPEEAVAWYRRAAEAGLAEAQLKLGNCLAKGNGAPADSDQAYYWVRQAADQFYAPAEFRIGKGYETGSLGKEINEEEAVQWVRRAAMHEYNDALFTLGEFYLKGFGVDKDVQKAVGWYVRAAELGSEDARLALGKNFDDWRDHFTEIEPIILYMNEHAAAGDSDIQRMLGAYLADSNETLDLAALKWLKAASDQGDLAATEKLGRVIMEHGTTDRDRNDAINLLKKVVQETGNPECMMAIASIYAEMDEPSALEESGKWYLATAKKGHLKAQIKCIFIYGQGIGVEKDRAEALAWALVVDANGKNAYKANLEPILSVDEKTKAYKRCRTLLMEIRNTK